VKESDVAKPKTMYIVQVYSKHGSEWLSVFATEDKAAAETQQGAFQQWWYDCGGYNDGARVMSVEVEQADVS
jgi:hypothetical protein